jgi:hypothetical protein
MIFLILLIIATGVLLAWLLVAVTRVTLGDLRVPRLHPSPEPPAGETHVEASLTAEPVARRETVIYDDSDAERAVREHLYGPRR